MPGLMWRKLDLHVHTPASECFQAESVSGSTGSVTPDMIVRAAQEKGLHGIAVTDHMSGEWVDLVKEAADSSGLIVFPGVELSVQSYHVIALFDRDFTTAHLNRLLGALGVQTQQGSTQHPIDKSFHEVCEIINEYEGLTVLAHIDCQHSGAWHQAGKVPVRRKVFNDPLYAAIELKEGDPPEPLIDQKVARNRGYTRQPAYYYASDNPCPDDPSKHCLEGIGSRYSWFKGEQDFNLECLRQCFTDPSQRIRRPQEFEESPIPRLVSIEVNGPFFGNAKFDFHRGLNSIIGGKGVGKSLLVEFLRLALDDTSGIDVILNDHCGKVVEQLGEGGRVLVECVSQTADRYIVDAVVTESRPSGGNPEYETTLEVRNADTDEILDVNIAELFPLKVFSQGEIVEISRRKAEQLLQVDSFVDLTDINDRIENLAASFVAEVETLLESRNALRVASELKRDIGTYKQKLKTLEKQLKADIFAKHKEYEKANELVEKAEAKWMELTDEVHELIRAFTDWQPTSVESDALVGSLVDQVSKIQTQARDELLTGLQAFHERTKELKLSYKEELEQWHSDLAEVTRKYEEHKEKAGGDYKSLDTRHEKLKRKIDNANKEFEKALAESRKWEIAYTEACRLAGELDAALNERYELRRDKAEELSDASRKTLRITVGESSEYQNALKALRWLQSGLHELTTLAPLAKSLASYRLVLLLLGIDPLEGYELPIEQEQLDKLRERVFSLDAPTEFFRKLVAALPADVPIIEFKKSSGEYAPLEGLSQGERCTALLVLTLLEGTVPVVIDQPEDSLDVRAIWEEIVQSIRSRKDSRQFIFTTHNSTIAVAGDSDCITILEPAGRGALVTSQGSIDCREVKDGVILHLEGGARSYHLRRQKYNIRDT